MSICHMALKGYTTYSVFSLNKTFFLVSIDSFLARKKAQNSSGDQNIGINHQSWFFLYLRIFKWTSSEHCSQIMGNLSMRIYFISNICSCFCQKPHVCSSHHLVGALVCDYTITVTVVTIFPQANINFNRKNMVFLYLSLPLSPSYNLYVCIY